MQATANVISLREEYGNNRPFMLLYRSLSIDVSNHMANAVEGRVPEIEGLPPVTAAPLRSNYALNLSV